MTFSSSLFILIHGSWFFLVHDLAHVSPPLNSWYLIPLVHNFDRVHPPLIPTS